MASVLLLVSAAMVGLGAAFFMRPERTIENIPAAQGTLQRPLSGTEVAVGAGSAGGSSARSAPNIAYHEPPTTRPTLALAAQTESGPAAAPSGPAPANFNRGENPAFVAARRAEGLGIGGALYSPAFAAGGHAIFYHAESPGRSALMRADTDAAGAVLQVTSILDDAARNFHVRPSPDGTQIAFDSDREGERAVYVADADGSGARRVSGAGIASIPSWSPDGRWLALVKAEPGRPRVWNLWLVALASGELRRLTSHPYGQPWGGSWFPDGRRIAYSHEDRLIVLDLEAGTRRAYQSPRAGRLVRTPAVSPDGRRILFQAFRDGTWLLDSQTGSMRKVLDDASAEEYTWSPDGQRVAYHSRRSGQWRVWIMEAAD